MPDTGYQPKTYRKDGGDTLVVKAVDGGKIMGQASAGAEPAQAAAAADLTDSTTGTADGTVADVSTAVTGVDGTGSNAASKADVDTRLGTINNNFADLAAKVNALLAAARNAGLIAQ